MINELVLSTSALPLEEQFKLMTLLNEIDGCRDASKLQEQLKECTKLMFIHKANQNMLMKKVLTYGEK